MKEEVITIGIDQIVANPYQPRLTFEDDALMELAQSIRENGLIQPISVRQVGNKYEIIAGERRFRAMKLNGLQEVPVYVLDKDNKEMAELALVENIQRENLSAVEEAKAYLDIMKLTGMTQSQLALKVGKSQSAVANKIRLLQLSDTVQQAVSEKRITERHARAMIGKEEAEQVELLQTIEKRGLNVAQTEKLLKKEEPKKKPKNLVMSKNVKIAINTLEQAVKMIERSGVDANLTQDQDGEDIVVTIRLKQ